MASTPDNTDIVHTSCTAWGSGGQADPSAPYQGTTFFISERNASDVTCLLAAVSLSYKTQSGFLPINQVRACGHDALFA
jgi:hypothetical protein